MKKFLTVLAISAVFSSSATFAEDLVPATDATVGNVSENSAVETTTTTEQKPVVEEKKETKKAVTKHKKNKKHHHKKPVN